MKIPSRAWVDAYCGSRTTVYQRVAGILAPLIYAGVFVFIALRWRYLPEQIPTHYDFAGNADGWGSRWNLIVMPAIGLLVDLTVAIASRFPRSWNAGVKITVFNKVRVYRLLRDLMADLRLSCALLFSWISVWIALGPDLMPGWILTVVSLVFILIPMLRYFIRLFLAR